MSCKANEPTNPKQKNKTKIIKNLNSLQGESSKNIHKNLQSSRPGDTGKTRVYIWTRDTVLPTTHKAGHAATDLPGEYVDGQMKNMQGMF